MQIFGTKTPVTIDTVVASFQKIVDDLRGLETKHTSAAEAAKEEAERQLQKSVSEKSEAARAKKVADRIGKLLAD